MKAEYMSVGNSLKARKRFLKLVRALSTRVRAAKMLQLRVFLMLLSTSTALTIFTASKVSSSPGFVSLLSYLPNVFSRNHPTHPLNATMLAAAVEKIDYDDVDFLSNDLEYQIVQLLGNEKDSIHNTEDIYPGRTGRQGSYGLFAQEKKTPYLSKQRKPIDVMQYSQPGRYRHMGVTPMMRKKIAGWQLEIFYNANIWEPFWPKMRVLLKNWADKRRFEPQVMRRLLQFVKQPIDESFHKLRAPTLRPDATGPGKRYRTCAVVGNSGVLLNSSYGSAIDEHEMVMRINNARTAGFESFVGAKTTISFVNSHIIRACAKRGQCWCHPYGAMVPIITYLCAPWHFMPIAFCSSEHAAPLLVTDPRFDNLCNRIAKWYSVNLFVQRPGMKPRWWSVLRNPNRQFHYSTGMQGVVMALGLCDTVHVYGFGKAKGLKHHYFSSQSEELKEIHDYNAEYAFYHDLERNDTSLLPFFEAAGISDLPTFKLML